MINTMALAVVRSRLCRDGQRLGDGGVSSLSPFSLLTQLPHFHDDVAFQERNDLKIDLLIVQCWVKILSAWIH
jgi:hypothetical protein